MSIRHPLTPTQIRADYTHHGHLHGVPIYVHADTCAVCERNGVPSWWLPLIVETNRFVNTVAAFLNPEFDPQWPIRLGQRIR